MSLNNEKFIFEQLQKEEAKFDKSLNTGLRIFEKEVRGKVVSGKVAFKLFSSYGFPMEMIKEVAKEKKLKVDEEGFKNAFNRGLLLKYDIVLIQEINRIPYRTQNAILEAMSDNQVTIAALGKTIKRKVLIIATMNDRDVDETYSLSRAI